MFLKKVFIASRSLTKYFGRDVDIKYGLHAKTFHCIAMQKLFNISLNGHFTYISGSDAGLDFHCTYSDWVCIENDRIIKFPFVFG